MKKISFTKTLLTLFLIILLVNCSNNKSDNYTLFKELPASTTGIYFENNLKFTSELNPYTYRNFYNGGGVGLTDFNKDNLLDIFFTGNQVKNKLYLNLGNFKFKDVTKSAGVASPGVWSTGVSIADINADGWPDIYVSKSGSPKGENRHNELFINNGDMTFSEEAEKWGLDVVGLSTDATFFDYDRDGDLDMYLLNNSFVPVSGASLQTSSREKDDPGGGDRLFQNQIIVEEGKKSSEAFRDVTSEAGIYSSAIGFGLDLLVGDINKDGWQDIYVSNDYFERDYLYLNNQDGTFEEQLPKMIKSTSLSSMGGDIADINRDGKLDIFVTDMLPENLSRQKSTTEFNFWDDYMMLVQHGYHHQFVRNTLQLNRGKLDTGLNTDSMRTVSPVQFSEIGRLANVYSTDWSWSALISDLDLDGQNDIFVTNGVYRDLTNQDYVNDLQSLRNLRSVIEGKMPVQELFNEMPSTPLSNYAFKGVNRFRFDNKALKWGLGKPGFSNGAAYGDLDNDGDLDLVLNNVNSKSDVYKNRIETLKPERNWLKVELRGKNNTAAVGANVTLWSGTQMFYREQMPNRGYQSSVDPRIHFGLGNNQQIDSLKVVWPGGGDTLVKKPSVNQLLLLREENSLKSDRVAQGYESKETGNSIKPALKNITSKVDLNYSHKENNFVDFKRNRLHFHVRSTEGPAACTADINNDGLDDLYLGGAKGQTGGIYLQNPGLQFNKISAKIFRKDRQSEDTVCTWFDVDGDQDQDLYVGSGGSEFPSSSSAITDRVYLNKNGADWVKAQALPANLASPTSTVQETDFDDDGDIDLFVGTRLMPFAYGMPVEGNLLENDGTGKFSDRTKKLAPELKQSGPITGSEWFDYDIDGDEDLVVVGEWMPIRLFKNHLEETGTVRFTEETLQTKMDSTNGWWKSVQIADLNQDGYPDIIAGNHGLNSIFKAEKKNPLSLYTGDFDQNGVFESIIAKKEEGEEVPMILRQDLLEQLPSMQRKFPSYQSYSETTVDELLNDAGVIKRWETYMLESAIFWNRKGKFFEQQSMPIEAQFGPIYGILAHRMDGDRNTIYLGGNLFGAKPQAGRYDASFGTTIKVRNKEKLMVQSHEESGLTFEGEIRSILKLNSGNSILYLVVRNNQRPLWFTKTD